MDHSWVEKHGKEFIIGQEGATILVYGQIFNNYEEAEQKLKDLENQGHKNLFIDIFSYKENFI